jgi:glycosyltransferase involved in cell wall biosynthesis
MKKICYVATVPYAIHVFLRGHVQVAADKYEVTAICNSTNANLLNGLKAHRIQLDIERKPSPLKDAQALARLYMLFRRDQFDIVHSIMPKTGLLAMLTGLLARVPNRIHTFTGQVWANKKGWKRQVLKLFDKLIVLFATQILVDSPSQLDFLLAEGVLPKGKGMVIRDGSICGFDENQFHPDTQVREAVRVELNIGLEQTVILFIGRLNRDKGVLDLATAFANIASSQTYLVMVGEAEDVSFETIKRICGLHCEKLRGIGFTSDPGRYMAAADILCLPSYREGFGQVIIEAAASGVPTVASRIYGITDAVEDGKTGLLFPAGDIAALTQALLKLIKDRDLAKQLGAAARLRALDLFPSQKISEAMISFYSDLLKGERKS